MDWKKIIIGCIAVITFTCIGYFSAWYGATEFEYTRQINVFYIVGKILLWPWLLWDWFRGFIFPEQKVHSFLSIGMSQFIGYFLLFYIVNKMYQAWKKFKSREM